MKLAITGASGLVGSALTSQWRAAGHEVLRFVRRPIDVAAEPGTIHWQPEGGRIGGGKLGGTEGGVHLGGESIGGLWAAGKKRRIRDSRVAGTRTLCDALAGMERPPSTLLAASAIGYYGSRGDE